MLEKIVTMVSKVILKATIGAIIAIVAIGIIITMSFPAITNHSSAGSIGSSSNSANSEQKTTSDKNYNIDLNENLGLKEKS